MADDIRVSVGVEDNVTSQLNRVNGSLNQIAAGVKSSAEQSTSAFQKMQSTIRLSATEISSAMMIFSRVFGAIKNIVQQLTGEFVKYANEVRNLKQISGESAEATSVLIQVADDYKISSGDLMMAQRRLARDGYTLNIDTIAKLSDEYLKLNTGSERQLFLTEHLGRSSTQWAEIMSQGSAKILAAQASVPGGLVLSASDLRSAREYEKALDELNDSVQELKVSAGGKGIPFITAGIDMLSANIDALTTIDDLITSIKNDLRVSTGSVSSAASIVGNISSWAAGIVKSHDITKDLPKEIDSATRSYQGWAEAIDARSTAKLVEDMEALKERQAEISQGFASALANTKPSLNQMAIAAYQASLAEDGLLDSMDAMAVLGFSQSLGEVDAKTAQAMATAINFQRILDDLKDKKVTITVDVLQNAMAQARAAAGVPAAASAWVPAGIVGGADMRPVYYNSSTGQYSLSPNSFVPVTAPPTQGVAEASTGTTAGAAQAYANVAGSAQRATDGVVSLGNAIDKLPPDFTRIYKMVFDVSSSGGSGVTFGGGGTGGVTPVASRASGGGFAGWAIVGDKPGGGWTPYTEAVYAPGGAYVLNAQQARARFGSQQPKGFASGGTVPPAVSGGDYNIYGNIYIEAPEDNRDLLANLRV